MNALEPGEHKETPAAVRESWSLVPGSFRLVRRGHFEPQNASKRPRFARFGPETSCFRWRWEVQRPWSRTSQGPKVRNLVGVEVGKVEERDGGERERGKGGAVDCLG